MFNIFEHHLKVKRKTGKYLMFDCVGGDLSSKEAKLKEKDLDQKSDEDD